jgi:EAL domain-containing protein (putative c-di-GMP-specific phosphodiesterase class I)
MAKGLDLKVVAEGVETREQHSFVTAHACDFMQGYLFARPVDEAAYRSYLENRQAGGEPPRLSRLG